MYLGIGASPAGLLDLRPNVGDRDDDDDGGDEEDGDGAAGGTPPVVVTSAYGSTIGLHGDVSPGKYARFMRTTNQLVLTDTEVVYQSAKRRIERDGSVVLSSLHFTCCVRPDILEVRMIHAVRIESWKWVSASWGRQGRTTLALAINYLSIDVESLLTRDRASSPHT